MRKFLKETKLGRFFTGFVKGAVRSLPLGNALVDGIENVSLKKEDGTRPHSWIAIAAEIAFVGLVIYAFITKMITVDDLLKYLLPLFSDVPTS